MGASSNQIPPDDSPRDSSRDLSRDLSRDSSRDLSRDSSRDSSPANPPPAARIDSARPAPIIVAHRGLHQLHPENSAGAFSAAWQGGVRWCECDIHFTADGVPVVIHDETLRRTTILTGAISEMNWADISRTLLIGCNCQPTVEKLPSLLAIIQLIPADRGLIIEIKPPVAAEMVLKNLPRGDERIMLQSFDETNLARLRDTGCEFPLALLVEDELSLLRAIDSPWESVRAKHSLLTPEIIGRINRSGKSVGAWTVNDPAEMRRLADLGVDMLITDFPLVAKEVLGID